MQAVSGFITDNGNFFESREAAEFHEAESVLRDKLLDAGIDPDRFMPLVIQLRIEIWRYVDAVLKISATSDDTSDESRRAEDNEAAVIQSVDRHSSMPDVGSGASTEDVPEHRKVDGA